MKSTKKTRREDQKLTRAEWLSEWMAKAGRISAENLSEAQRRERGRNAAKARWSRVKPEPQKPA